MLANLARARERLLRDGADAWVCVQPKNVYYLSDYESDWLFDLPWAACAILTADDERESTLVVHDVELTNLAERPSWMPRVRPYFAAVGGRAFAHYAAPDDAELDPLEREVLRIEAEWEPHGDGSCVAAAVAALRRLGLAHARVGFDDLRFRDACTAALPGIQPFDAQPALLWTRQVKTNAELTIMREAAARNQGAIGAALDTVTEGVPWRHVRRAYCVAAASADCAAQSFFVGAGRKSMGLWADMDYPVPRHAPVCLDAMLTYRRYFGDAQRTAVVGEPTAKLERYWNAVSTAAAEAYDAMRPGVSTADLRARAIDTVRRLGVPHFRHAFVHGLGLDHLELPGEGRDFGTFTLEADMVVNMDLEVCELGFGGVYFEQTMRITERGAECLYTMPRELVRLQ
jgi:Xaa-Pro dipeptidase